jgi:biofilm PGA synthesis N-glycosyltransferase PgaC
MIEQIFFVIFIIVSVINITHFGLYLVGANYYDIKRFKKDSKVYKKKRGLRPLVSVLIPAHNEELSIVRCLETVRKSTHRKFEIIVVDDASTDNTKRIVKKYIEDHPWVNIKLMYKQKNSGKANALNHALRHGAKGQLIMTLDADSGLGKKSMANAVRYFDDERVVGVAANVRVLDNFKILGLLQVFEYMIGYRSKKFYSLSNSEFIIGGVGSTYRTEVMKSVGYYDKDIITEDIALSLKVAAQGNRENRLVYGVDVIAMTEAVGSLKGLMRQRYRWKMGILQSLVRQKHLLGNINSKYSLSLTFYRIPMAFFGELLIILEPFAIAFVVFLMIKSGNPMFLIGTYMTITGYMFLNIWPDELMNRRRKIKMSLLSVPMYMVFYIMNFVQLTSIIRCLFNYKQVTLKKNTTTTWVSPARSLSTS